MTVIQHSCKYNGRLVTIHSTDDMLYGPSAPRTICCTDIKKHIVIVPNSNEERRRSLKTLRGSLKTFRRSLKTFRGSLNRHFKCLTKAGVQDA